MQIFGDLDQSSIISVGINDVRARQNYLNKPKNERGSCSIVSRDPACSGGKSFLFFFCSFILLQYLYLLYGRRRVYTYIIFIIIPHCTRRRARGERRGPGVGGLVRDFTSSRGPEEARRGSAPPLPPYRPGVFCRRPASTGRVQMFLRPYPTPLTRYVRL